jgi:dTDP-4-amino-4,6-dideoxygalactose transaminase
MSFDALFEFESALAKYTGAPYVVLTDGCTHAIELCMRYDSVKKTKFTAYTYLSVPMLMRHLDIEYEMITEKWAGEYQFYGTRIWDSARRLERNMYNSGTMQCLSFGWTKPLQLGKVGAILLDDADAYHVMSRQRSDGRDLHVPWETETNLIQGYHYCPTLELCTKGLELLPTVNEQPKYVQYPDCRNFTIKD